MASTRTRYLLAGGATLFLCLAGGILYALGLPPFDTKTGEIKASEVCKTLGPSSRSVASLKLVLPGKSSYSFDDTVTDPRRDDIDDSYTSFCFVGGDGKQLLVATAEMLQYENTDEWVKDMVEKSVSGSTVQPFSAGDKAVASDKLAVIYVPCVSRGFGRHLSVAVELKEHGGASDDQLREGLISLARNAALFAHQNAKCDAPAKVTG
ncbi:hypothetical protein ACH5A3_20905 [Streptomyces echinatus]|uniref:hypothetical protein n=1 Tax=Streptomyces echinatus TaxID=67293 RepID=UPI0037BA06A1